MLSPQFPASPRLQRKNYRAIKTAMAGDRHQYGALAAVRINDEHIARGFPGLARGSFDRTLTSQLKHLLSQDDRPDLYLFTAKSAIPVADAFRGFFGDNHPVLGHIEANRKSALSHIDRYVPAESQAVFAHQTEVERLRELAKTATHTCIVEQFSSTETLFTLHSCAVLGSLLESN